MKRRNCFIAIPLILIFVSPFLGNTFSKKEAEEEILRRIQTVKEEFKGKTFYFVKIQQKKESSQLLASLCNSFIEENRFALNYLITPIQIAFVKKIGESTPSQEDAKNLFEKLRVEDKKLFEPFSKLFLHYLKAKGHRIEGWKPAESRTYSFEKDLLPIAVRFIYPSEILKDKRTKLHICSGINGLRDYCCREPYLEAFAFEVIFKSLREKENPALSNLKEHLKLVKKLNFSPSSREDLYRIQGALWILLYQDQNLKHALRSSYERKKAFLPFKLVFE